MNYQPEGPRRETRPATSVKRMLSRKNGAKVDEIRAATAWQPHSVRAQVYGSGGSNVTREERRDGSKAYRLVKALAAPAGDQWLQRRSSDSRP